MRLPQLRSAARYTAHVASAMDEVLARARERAAACGRSRLSLMSSRVIFLSDVHRGVRNAADDFRQNERAYNSALAYYLRMGHTLILLGDVEELWEERPAAIFAAYPRTYELEAQFHQEGRYLRIWGNHDDLWQHERKVRQLLQPVYGDPPLRVFESMLMDVVDGEEVLGTLLLTHGHHGDAKSSRWAWLSRQVIRYFWRFYQRLTRATPNMPAVDWELRHKLNRAMSLWALRQPGLILFTGHTHGPVFESLSHSGQLEDELAGLEDAARIAPDPALLERQALLLARLEWIHTKEEQAHRTIGGGSHITKPCYFNPGCSCYNDGDITGIEIIYGNIRLVRWPDEAGDPRPEILVQDSLRAVLGAC